MVTVEERKISICFINAGRDCSGGEMKDLLNEKKIRLMTELAKYEDGSGRKDLRISRYFRTDYLGLALFRNFFLTTIGYGMVLLLIGLYFMDDLADVMMDMDLALVLLIIIGGYLITLVFYSIASYAVHAIRYRRAAHVLETYESRLEELNAMYEAAETGGRRRERR